MNNVETAEGSLMIKEKDVPAEQNNHVKISMNFNSEGNEQEEIEETSSISECSAGSSDVEQKVRRVSNEQKGPRVSFSLNLNSDVRKVRRREKTNSSWSLNETFCAPSGSDVPVPRLVERNLSFHQSKNIFNVKNNYKKHQWELFWSILNRDLFHVSLRLRTFTSLFILCFLWTAFIIVFAVIYIIADKLNPGVDCGLGVEGDGTTIPFYTAFAFSLETSTTVGYGLPGNSSAFFHNCPYILLSIYCQQISSMIFNAFILALLFARFSRCEARSNQVLFTNKAIIRKDKRGRFLFEVKLYDIDSKFPIVEAHVRMYLVHPNSNRNYIPLRILRPNDDYGATVCSSIPTAVTHHIDAYSALLPPEFRRTVNIVDPLSLLLREVDSFTGTRYGVPCNVCGELFVTVERLLKHIRYQRLMEKHDNIPVKGSHQELNEEEILNLTSISTRYLTLEDLRDYWNRNTMEVLVIFEGIDPLSSGSFQAMQSYQADDIFYGGLFTPVFSETNEVNLANFHQIIPQ